MIPWTLAPASPQPPAPVGWSVSMNGNDVFVSAGIATDTAPTVLMIVRNSSGKVERQFVSTTRAAQLGIVLDPATITGGNGLIQLSV